MAETTTTRTVNLYQLGLEIGGTPAMRKVGPDASGVTTVQVAGVTKAALDAKLAAHVADPNIKPAKPAEQVQDEAEVDFIKTRFPAALVKARQIMASPNDAGLAPTAAEQRVAWALTVIDIARRYR